MLSGTYLHDSITTTILTSYTNISGAYEQRPALATALATHSARVELDEYNNLDERYYIDAELEVAPIHNISHISNFNIDEIIFKRFPNNNVDFINGSRSDDINDSSILWDQDQVDSGINNWWALVALVLVVCTAAGNVLVCLAICWERRLQNVTNYFLMSLAVTDLLVAILVMPLGILTLVRGYFPLAAVWCLAWICLDVLLCTASIMHLCTISVDRYLSLRYPMRFGRNKTRRRVTLKIIFVWILSTAMSLPLSLMYSKDQESVLIDGTCQIPDPLYKLIGSIVSFYIPLVVMLLTYALTVRLLARQRRGLGAGWAAGWLAPPQIERRCTWRRLLGARAGTPQHSAASTDTELPALDANDLWLQDISEPAPSAMTALHQFGAEMLRLSRGLEESAAPARPSPPFKPSGFLAPSSLNTTTASPSPISQDPARQRSSSHHVTPDTFHKTPHCQDQYSTTKTTTNIFKQNRRSSKSDRPRSMSDDEGHDTLLMPGNLTSKSRSSEDNFPLPPPCTCPYFGDNSSESTAAFIQRPTEVIIVPSDEVRSTNGFNSKRKLKNIKSDTHLNKIDSNSSFPRRPSQRNTATAVVTWDENKRFQRGSSFGSTRTSIISVTSGRSYQHRRANTLRLQNGLENSVKATSSPPRSAAGGTPIRPHHSRNSSVISRNSSRHGRILRLEQKATKVLGVVFFTFVVLWAPFFILNLIPAFCYECEQRISHWVFDFVTWLGYASSMVNPIFYTIFNKIFRQAFKKVLNCQYCKKAYRAPNR